MAKNGLKVRLPCAACSVPVVDICDSQDSSFNRNAISCSIWKLRIPVDSPHISLQFAFDFYSSRPYLHHQISHYHLKCFKWPTIFIHLSSWRDTKKIGIKRYLWNFVRNILISSQKKTWKFQLLTFADLIVRAILVIRCLAPGPPPLARHRNLRLNTCLGTSRPGTRELGGGGAVGQLPQLGSFGSSAPPQLWTVDAVHLYFRLFLHLNLCLPKK